MQARLSRAGRSGPSLSLALASVLLALGACGESSVTDPYQDAAGVFVLESIAGDELPALIASSPSEGAVIVTTGSLFLSSDRRFQETLTLRHEPPEGPAQNGTAVTSGSYAVVGDSVEFTLREAGEDTGTKVQARLRGDTLSYEVFGRVVLYLKL